MSQATGAYPDPPALAALLAERPAGEPARSIQSIAKEVGADELVLATLLQGARTPETTWCVLPCRPAATPAASTPPSIVAKRTKGVSERGGWFSSPLGEPPDYDFASCNERESELDFTK